jgi:hypothetical protein
MLAAGLEMPGFLFIHIYISENVHFCAGIPSEQVVLSNQSVVVHRDAKIRSQNCANFFDFFPMFNYY